jgi:hypothetical protein
MNASAITGGANMPASVIAAMHHRYEVLDRQYNATDRASNGAAEDRRSRLYEALQDMQRETDALRVAILRQRLADHQDLAIFAFHLHNATDMIAAIGPDEMKVGDQELLDLVNYAAETIFDYVVGEGFGDMERLGASFHSAAMRCHERRQDREGLPPESDGETSK